MSTKLEDYSFIGDSSSAALLSKKGSIDWCCIPNFDSPSIFSKILGDNGGHFSLSPKLDFQSSQNYIEDTNVVETHFETETGNICLIDSFSVREEEDKKILLFPDHEILRIVEGISGGVAVIMEFEPRIFYGKKCPKFTIHKTLGIQFTWKENIFILQSTLSIDQFSIKEDEAKVAVEFFLKEGEKVVFSLSYSCQNPAILPELKLTGHDRLLTSVKFWKNWISNCTYSGVYEKEVRRSLLALKLMTHAPSGAIIAAPTTSIPEEIGGSKNWDYRYCWLRDASFTIRVLVKLGFEKEANAYINWIQHATQLTRPKIQVVYSIFGHARLKEKTLEWLSGYRNSKPVRIGNGAHDQFQLDVYGEVLDAFFTFSSLVDKFDRRTKKFVVDLGKMICKLWELPDNGIWEVRDSRLQHTHSKVMAWVGLDRIVKLAKKFQWNDVSIRNFKKVADLIYQDVEEYGFNKDLMAYTKVFNGDSLDASLLTLPLVDYCDASSMRMASTTKMIEQQLSKKNLIYRYKDQESGVELEAKSSFGICTFWYIETLAKMGEVNKAIEYFENVLAYASPTGLLAEEMDPDNHELLGNYPQGYSHIGLINAALSIQDAMDQKKEL